MERWMHGIRNADEQAPLLAAAGFTTVVCSPDHARSVHDAGMDAWLCGSGFPLIRDDDAIRAVGVDGRPYTWFNSGSPCATEVREASLEAYRRMARTEGVTGILVDGCRFASPASGPEAFLTDFSDHAARRAEELGMDIEIMRRDLMRLRQALRALAGAERPCPARELHAHATLPLARIMETLIDHPGVAEWLRFRRAHVTGHFRAIADIVHAAGLQCGAYVFTPSLAPLVGQNYEDLAGIMDVVSPMVYRAYPEEPGIAALNHEVAALVAAATDHAAAPPARTAESTPGRASFVAALLDALGYGGLAAEPAPQSIRAGLGTAVVGIECARAKAALGNGPRLVPIIQIDDPDLPAAEAEVAAAGCDACDYFVFTEEWRSLIGG